MPTESDIYNELLTVYGDTLTTVSRDTTNRISVITNDLRVVNVDKFTTDIKNKFPLDTTPSSCDALYMLNDEWFLIEFKNGTIVFESGKPDTELFYDIIRKIFESLLLLNEKLNQTINDTRKNFTFILVFNDNNNSYLAAKNGLTKFGNKNSRLPLSPLSDILPYKFNVRYFDKLYFKGMFICSKTQFENWFVKKYCNRCK